MFAANDEMAAGIIAGANARNVSVPQDLGVVGFDDTRVAQMTDPLLDDGPRADVEDGCDGDRAVVPTNCGARAAAGQGFAEGRTGGPRFMRLRAKRGVNANCKMRNRQSAI